MVGVSLDSRPNALQKMIKTIPEIMIKVEKTESWFQQNYKMEYNPFTIIHNILGFITELLNWFDASWSREEKEEVFKSEYTIQKDKIIYVTRWGFIQTFSIIEFTIKEIIKKERYEPFSGCLIIWERGEFVSFYKIIKIFNDMCIINDEDYIKWGDLREIRNCLVHNNAYTDIDIEYELNGHKIVRTKNSMLRGDLNGFIILVEQITKLYSVLLWNLFTQEPRPRAQF